MKDEVEYILADHTLTQRNDVYRICHAYDIGDQNVFICRNSGNINAKEAAIFLQFKAEEFFGHDVMITNLGIAALLIQFYGFKHWPATPFCEIVDMHSDRERLCNAKYYDALMANPEFYRDNLKDCIRFHLTN